MDHNSIEDNIINCELLNQTDKDDLQLNIGNLIELFIFNNPLIFSNEKFESILFNYIYDNAIITLQEVYPNDPSWYLNGPPYHAADTSLDEYDIESCNRVNHEENK